jgi:NADPH-dependent curcumin reductase CurA
MAKQFLHHKGKLYVTMEHAAEMVAELSTVANPGSSAWIALQEVIRLFNDIELQTIRQIHAERTKNRNR